VADIWNFSNEDLYESGVRQRWQGRIDDEPPCRIHQLIKCHDLHDSFPGPSKKVNIALLGCAVDEGIRRNKGRVGAKLGPQALRVALANKVVHSSNNLNLFDVGTIVNGKDLAAAQQNLGEAVARVVGKGLLSIVLGGGHEIAFGHFLGLHACFPGSTIGVINIDAHFDVRPLLADGSGTSGTPFLQIAQKVAQDGGEFNYLCIGAQRAANSPALFRTMQELGAQYILASEMSANNEECLLKLQKFIGRHEYIYVSICLDAFASAYAPGVSAPQPLGLEPQVIVPVLKELAQSGKMIAFDIAELSPPFDENGQTAQLGAQIIIELIQTLVDAQGE